MSPLLLHSNTNQYNINVYFVLTPRCFAYRHAATTFYQLQRSFGDRRQHAWIKEFLSVLFSPQLILQFIEGSNGFIAEKAILIIYQGSRGSLIFQGGGCPTFSRGVQMLISIETLIALVIFQSGGVRTPIPLWIRTWAMSS